MSRLGSRWGFMKKVDVMDIDSPEDVYLTRWYLLETPYFGIKVHHILRPDADYALHDHPWDFVTFILKGGYEEELPVGEWQGKAWITETYTRRPFSIRRIKKLALHRIAKINGDCWTLVFCGPAKRDWGFSEGPNHWQYWEEYHEQNSHSS